MNTITRRAFIAAAAAGAVALAAPAFAIAAATRPANPSPRMGLTIASYSVRWGSKQTSDNYPGWETALDVLDHCAALRAGGLQVGVGGWQADFAKAVRDRRESLGLYLEGQIGLPKAEPDVPRFEAEARSAREAGAVILRTAIGNRRYEDFDSADDFRRFRESAWRSLTLVEPVARRVGVKLAVENHKDWRVPDLIDILKRLGSEQVGVNLDVGNSIALLEDPMAVVEALAPYALTTHFKDMAVREYEQGFLLSEVPLGEGLLDLPRIMAACRKTNPSIRFNLETITRDPLRIPCLTERYWATLSDVPGRDLAKALALVRTRGWGRPLPEVSGLTPEQRLAVEEENVRKCFAHSREKLGMS